MGGTGRECGKLSPTLAQWSAVDLDKLRRPFSPQLLVPAKIAKLPLQRRTSPSPWGPEDVGVKSGHSRHLR